MSGSTFGAAQLRTSPRWRERIGRQIQIATSVEGTATLALSRPDDGALPLSAPRAEQPTQLSKNGKRMGQRNRGIKAFMEAYLSNVSSVAPSSPQAPRRTVGDGAPDIDGMTSLELLYQLCKLDGTEVIGSPERAFAVYDASQEVLHVYAKDAGFVHMASQESSTMLAALESARTSGASFMVCDEEVVCVLNNVSARGKTYGEAALRALAKYQLATALKHGDENASVFA